jgi:hypothetical protein
MNRNTTHKPRVYILSAYRDKLGEAINRRNHCDLSHDLLLVDNPWQECEGSYKGQRESSFIVTGITAGKKVRALARLYRQESYLVATEHTREAYIVDCETGYHTHVGRLEYAGDTEPDDDSWTCVDGRYYVTRPYGALTDLPEGF